VQTGEETEAQTSLVCKVGGELCQGGNKATRKHETQGSRREKRLPEKTRDRSLLGGFKEKRKGPVG